MGLFDRFKKKENAESGQDRETEKAAVSFELDTPRTKELYQQLAEKITEIIPDKWSDVYFYGEVLDDSTTTYFYYRQAENGAMLYSHYIPKVYKVSEAVYMKLLHEINKIIRQLRDEYKENGRKVWTNFTMTLDSTGKFNIKYNYENVLNGEYTVTERRMIWSYEVLGRIPVEDRMREAVQKYLGSKIKIPEKNKLIGQTINSSKCPACGKPEVTKRDNLLYRCQNCNNRFFTDSHNVIMYVYDQELIEAVTRAQQFAAKEEYGNALKELVPYENRAWDNLGLLMQLALSYRRAGYNDIAMYWYEQIKYLKPDYAMAYHGIGFIYFLERKYSLALKEYETAFPIIEADPDTYPASERAILYAFYGGSLAGDGKKEEGEAIIRKAETQGYNNGNVIREMVGLAPKT